MNNPITPLYNVKLRRPGQRAKQIATVRAIASRTPVGTWFQRTAQIMKPDADAIREAIPAKLRKSFDLHKEFWFRDNSMEAFIKLYSAKGKLLGWVEYEGYYYE